MGREEERPWKRLYVFDKLFLPYQPEISYHQGVVRNLFCSLFASTNPAYEEEEEEEEENESGVSVTPTGSTVGLVSSKAAQKPPSATKRTSAPPQRVKETQRTQEPRRLQEIQRQRELSDDESEEESEVSEEESETEPESEAPPAQVTINNLF